MSESAIIVLPYDPNWAIHFQELKALFLEHLSEVKIEVQHVGSTAVPGLWAKPVLDIDLIVEDYSNLDFLIRKLSDLGYEHRGDLGIPEREAFKRISEKVPFLDGKEKWMEHHLYICRKGADALENHLVLRNHLLKNKGARMAYSKLKQSLAEKYKYDGALYTEGKTDFILEVLGQYGFSAEAKEAIKYVNLANKNKEKI